MNSRFESYVRSVYTLTDQLQIVESDIKILEDSLMRVTASYESDPVSGGDPLDNRREKEARLADLQTQQKDLQQRIYSNRRSLSDLFEKVQDYRQKRTLQLHYCDMRSFSDMARLMNCAVRSVYRYHAAGLVSAERFFLLTRR